MQNNKIGKWRGAVSAILVCAMSVLPYLSTLPHYFLTDDFGLVQLFNDKPIWHFLTLFDRSYAQGTWGFTTDELRPFPALLYRAGAASPILQHSISVALHVLTALLVLAIARLVARASWTASAFSAGLFCVLPAHVETVAWITGRVDALLALAYGLSFLGFVFWRKTGVRAYLGWSLAAYFVALYTKQSAITLPATIFLCDWLLLGRRPALSRAGWMPYLPYLALTAAMLALRYVLFGNFFREDALSASAVGAQYMGMQARYLQFLLIGKAPLTTAQFLILPAAVLLCALAAVRFDMQRIRVIASTAISSERLRIALFFLPAWWLITTAPLIVAGYTSERFLYLPAFGVAVGLGCLLDALLDSRPPRRRYAAITGATALIALAFMALLPKIDEMNSEASVSRSILVEIRKEAAALPEGALLVIDEGSRPWGYALPFALQPPFADSDIPAKFPFICPQMTYFHPQAWYADMQSAVGKWIADTKSPPIVVLRWDPATGRHARRTDGELPDLRLFARDLAAASSAQDLSGRLRLLLERVPL